MTDQTSPKTNGSHSNHVLVERGPSCSPGTLWRFLACVGVVAMAGGAVWRSSLQTVKAKSDHATTHEQGNDVQPVEHEKRAPGRLIPIPPGTSLGGEGDATSAGGGTVVYRNRTANFFSHYSPGANVSLADDLTLIGTNRKLDRIRHVCVHSLGPSMYSVAMELWCDDPNDPAGCTPLSPILGAFCFEPDLAPGTIWDAAASASSPPCDFPLSSGPVLSDKVWLIVQFSDDDAGWERAGNTTDIVDLMPDVGSTMDRVSVSLNQGTTWSCINTTPFYDGHCAEIYADPAPTGACCDDNTGVCTNGVTKTTCECSDRRYGGDGSTCSTIVPPCTPPPTGACCTMNGTCSITTQSGCSSIGTYAGDETTCSPTGACCLDHDMDGRKENCATTSQTCCILAGGTFKGPGSACVPSGACCFDGNGDFILESCLTTSQACCGDFPGAFRGSGSACGSIHGDVHPPPKGNGVVDLDDILRVLCAFGDQQTCDNADMHPCGGNGVVDLDDILSVLEAFAGNFQCPGTCPAPHQDEGPANGHGSACPGGGCQSCEQGGEMVALFSGEARISAGDFRVPGLGFDLDWSVQYRSKIGPNTVMGNGWDYSYNIYLETLGSALELHDGNARVDTYADCGPSWVKPGFFDEITQNVDGSYTLTFADTGQWNFHPLGGAANAGKIASIVDRNGNTMTFTYGALGRLSTVTDTLGRNISISYNADGFISTVTDFLGRQTKYEYYQDGDAGGSFGDLKSIGTPAVVGTSVGNNFPFGKTTVYTYTKGFANQRLNHNLLTVTDPKGQTFLEFEYHPATNPVDPIFDRVIRKKEGDVGEVTEYVYQSQTPGPVNNQATQKTIEVDRNGHLTEYFYNAANEMVIEREYTGRWDHGLPMIDPNNPTYPKLRPTDPAYYETRWVYDTAEDLLLEVTHPNGDKEVFTYDTGNANRRSKGNMLSHCRLPGPLGGDQATICEYFEYDDNMGGCCGTNFVTKHTDGRGHETNHQYDAQGNRTHTQHRIPAIVEEFEYDSFGRMSKHVHPDNGGCRRVDVYTYYEPADGCQNGYLKQEVIDATAPESCGGSHFNLTTTYEYDCAGNVVRTVDPRGHDTLYEVNALNQVVRETSREVTDGGGVRYQTDTYYDANDNVVRTDVQNKNENGVLQPNSHFTTIHEYDILNHRTRTCTESGVYIVPAGQLNCTGLPQSEFIITETEYDANRNPIHRRSGEAVNGNQPDNVTETIYDERDMPLRTTRAPTDAGKSTTQYDYDANGNLIRTVGGTEDLVNPRITIVEYDGYDRAVRTVDPVGNESTTHYDSNGNRVSGRTDGALTNDLPGGAGNVRLSEGVYEYDAMDRLIRADAAHFNPQTQTPIGDGLSTTITEYTDNSQVKRVLDDNNHQTVTTYDTANRRKTTTDHKGNSVTYEYDANSNVTSMVELEKSDLLNPDQSFTTTHTYDNLDRLNRAVDPAANTNEYFYDSRDNRVMSLDALRPNNPADPGNKITYAYDGINRLISTVRILTSDGTGTGAPAGTITTTQTWDDDSRLTSQADDNGNATRYAYDALDRLIVTQMADGTIQQVGSGAVWPLGNPAPNLGGFTSGYDVHDNRITLRDANESVLTAVYDLLNRQTSKSIVPGPGVADNLNGGTITETYEYDGLSRLMRAQDDDSRVTRQYDSLSNITREVQNQVPPFAAGNDRVVLSTYDGDGNKTQCTYPGGRIITTAYDTLDRKKTITDVTGAPQMIATYDYIGPGRVERRDYGNGTRAEYTYDGILPNPPNDFGVKQIVRMKHTKIVGGAVIDDRTFTWDRMGNKTQRKDIRVGGPMLTHDYFYDSVYRLVRSVRTPPGGPAGTVNYSLDGVGNRTSVLGGPDPGVYTMDPTLPEPADRQTNQYTTTPPDARGYDRNGNLVSIDPPPAGPPSLRIIVYDYRNQMVRHTDFATGVVSTYAYDALGRRIRKIVDVNGVSGGPTETRFYLDGWQEIEEQSAAGATLATYVFGLYIDEVLNMRRDVIPGGGPEDYYYHTDDLYNVMAMSDAAGAVVERYEYEDYGRPLDPVTLAPLISSTLSNPLLFTGRRFDSDTSFYYYRTRYLDPSVGRFTIYDSLGVWLDRHNYGNGYTYSAHKPWSSIDPLGLETFEAKYNVWGREKTNWAGTYVTYNWVDTGNAVASFDITVTKNKLTVDDVHDNSNNTQATVVIRRWTSYLGPLLGYLWWHDTGAMAHAANGKSKPICCLDRPKRWGVEVRADFISTTGALKVTKGASMKLEGGGVEGGITWQEERENQGFTVKPSAKYLLCPDGNGGYSVSLLSTSGEGIADKENVWYYFQKIDGMNWFSSNLVHVKKR